MSRLDELLGLVPDLSPYDIDNDGDYHRWRDAKLADHPQRLEDLIVEVANPLAPTEAEFAAMLDRLRRANMVIYASPLGDDPDKDIPRALAVRFGLSRLDRNYLADDDGLTSLMVRHDGTRRHYIPYTDRPIKWHTDGYYNDAEHQIRGFMLHCVRPAAEGGENALMDHEIAYLRIRDEDPAHIRALMETDAMTIPPGRDGEGGERAAAVGPIFSVDPAAGSLHMRYTARQRNIEWKDTPAVRAAVACLERVLSEEKVFAFRARLESGMGLISNNVLHDRAGFRERPGQPGRLIYRGRFFDRVAATGLRDRD